MNMRFDVQKIDERIKKLQELRRIATDPEITGILSEFLSAGNETAQPVLPVLPALPIKAEPTELPSPEITNDLINEMVQGVDSPSNGKLWGRRR